MHTQKGKPKKNKSQVGANFLTQSKSNCQRNSEFVDNRPEMIIQKKLQAMAYNYSESKNPVSPKIQSSTIQKQDSYTLEDKRMITKYWLNFRNENHDGDRYFEAFANNEDTEINKNQEYLYRAMNKGEAESWINKNGDIDPKGHQGWASFRLYSRQYLEEKKYNYTHLLEIRAPKFIKEMKSMGATPGSESGDHSWGIGGMPKTGYKGTEKTSKIIKKMYKNKFDKKAPNKPKGGMLSLINKLSPKIFKDSIEVVELVDLKSKKP